MGVTSVFFNTPIGNYTFDAVFSTDHETNLTITQEPVQSGASISDHAYMEPNQVIFDIGMSDVMQSFNGLFADGDSRSVSAYQVLLKLQNQALPIQVATRLNTYTNMLIPTLSTTDDNTTAHGLRVTVTLQEIKVVEVATVQISARPQTSVNTNNGAAKVATADSSILSSLMKSLGL